MARNPNPEANREEVPVGKELLGTEDANALALSGERRVGTALHALENLENKEKSEFDEARERAKGYVDKTLSGADKKGRKIYDSAMQSFSEVDDVHSRELCNTYRQSIDRLNRFGWEPKTVATVVNVDKKTMFVLYKGTSDEIHFLGASRIETGKGTLGSNVKDSNGTPLGMLRMLPPKDLTLDDNYPIGMSKMDPEAKIKPRGESYLATRWLRMEGLERGNSNSHDRAIMWHGSARLDRVRPNESQASSGCVIASNADVIHIWSYLRQNIFQGKGVLCDVIRSESAQNAS